MRAVDLIWSDLETDQIEAKNLSVPKSTGGGGADGVQLKTWLFPVVFKGKLAAKNWLSD